MKFLVTGCAGFIGSHLSEYLLSLGHEIKGVDSLNNYYSPELKLENLKILKKYENFSFIKGDFLKEDSFKEVGDSINYNGLFHIGGYAGVRYSLENPLTYIDHNIKVSIKLFEWCKTNKEIKIVVASSSSIYGEQNESPFKEGTNAEDYPVSQYAATKRSIELFGYTYHTLFGLNITFLRFFTVYGPRGRVDMAPLKFMVQILNNKTINLYGNGEFRRDFTYVSEIVEGIYKAYETTKGYDVINIGCGEPHSIMELITTIEEVTGKKAKINFQETVLGDVSQTYADITKANKKFNFVSEIKLKEGMKYTFDWFSDLTNEIKSLLLQNTQK